MAQTKRKGEWEAELQPAVASSITAASDRTQPTGSPARALQQMLEERTAVAADGERWSQRRALAFIVAASAALWIAILGAAHGVMALVA